MGAPTVHIDRVVGRSESDRRGDLVEGPGEHDLDGLGEHDVDHDAAPVADEVVMMPGEMLVELEQCVVPDVDEATHDADIGEHREAPVDRTLGEGRIGSEEVGQGDRTAGSSKELHDGASVRRVLLIVFGESVRDRSVQVARAVALAGGWHHGIPPGVVAGSCT